MQGKKKARKKSVKKIYYNRIAVFIIVICLGVFGITLYFSCGKEINYQTDEIYYIKTSEFSDLYSATLSAEIQKLKNGAGLVIEQNNSYALCYDMYLSKPHAEAFARALKLEGLSCDIEKLDSKLIKIKASNDKSENAALLSALSKTGYFITKLDGMIAQYRNKNSSDELVKKKLTLLSNEISNFLDSLGNKNFDKLQFYKNIYFDTLYTIAGVQNDVQYKNTESKIRAVKCSILEGLYKLE